ncbi:MAG: putative porin, partial [Selenomonadaceae bacterium]|nr:putative porin [Selenomonadaceae bacterium]
AASTTFAAANPFSDVPADHWAYDAIAQLAAEGVVDGYGDGSYRGEQEITRYEMAQMVARAMAKGVSSATLDKLAAEFADELNQLGVRVAALEKKVDNVKFTGELRYRASRKTPAEYRNNGANKNELLVRLNMKAQVNEHWTVNTRFDYSDATNGKTSGDVNKVTVDRMWAQGQYGKTTVNLGKFNYKTAADYGLFNDRRVTGLQVVTSIKDINVAVTAGRVLLDKSPSEVANKTNTASIWGIDVYSNRAKKFTYGATYNNLKNKGSFDKNNLGVWTIGAGYKFTKSVALEAAYGRSNAKDTAGKQKTRYAVTLKYKGANVAKRGSYGLFVGYRHIGSRSGLFNTYAATNDVMPNDNTKGWELGADYTLDKNILLGVRYYMGKAIDKTLAGTSKQRCLMGQVEFFF